MTPRQPNGRPLVGLTCDADPERAFLRLPYVDAIIDAGGLPLLLPPRAALAAHFAELCDAVVLTGGDDPRMEEFGVATHPQAAPVAAERQAFELAMLNALAQRPRTPVLGICLGMQYMALHAGGTLHQHLPDTLPTHALHWGRVSHEVEATILGRALRGTVLSHHRQAVNDAGSLQVAGRAPDGVIECVLDPSRPFYLGVQWHPERTVDAAMGAGLIQRLVAAATPRAARALDVRP